ncbi:S.griseus streptomycin-3'-phosphotransferase protein OS=Streptomyces griseus OX=1911 PE=4 SV=1 [Streptomyces griseus subsp. griseus]
MNSGSDVIVSGMLIGLLMAQIAQNRHLAAVFEELLSAEGNTVCLRPAGAYIRPGAEATFAGVVAAARDRGECAIGYRRHDITRTGTGDQGIRLNPPKGERRVWYAEDQVVVIATDHHGPPAPAAGPDASDTADSAPSGAR